MDCMLNFDRHQQEDYYEILGCDELSSTEQILQEFKVLSICYHPDKNQGDKEAVIKFQKLLNAKEILCNPEMRSCYDKWRRSRLTIPFDQFLNLNKNAHSSFHWASKKQKECMIESGTESCSDESCNDLKTDCKPKVMWERDSGSELLRRFRNYEV